MSDKLVAIHQPNFLPWLGWWDKLARADVFVLLDDVQFQKTAGNWTNRVQILVNAKPSWLTVPVSRKFHGVKKINEIEIDESRPWRKKMRRTLEMSYGRAPAYEEAFPPLAEVIEHQAGGLAVFNENALRRLAEKMGLEAGRFVRASGLGATGKATDLLVEIVREVGGGAYLTGGGAGGYQDEKAFEEAGIEVVRQEFAPKPYPQRGADSFVAGLSIADALLNLGFDRTRRVLGA